MRACVVALLVALLGCSEDESLFGEKQSDASAGVGGSSGDGAGSGNEGGNAAGGVGGASTGSSSSSGTASSGPSDPCNGCPEGTTCACDPPACVASTPALVCGDSNCGDVQQVCGIVVDCGTCGAGERCSARGHCEPECTEKTCDQMPSACGPTDDGCGGTAFCDDTCGDGVWMYCSGACYCLAAPFEANQLCQSIGGGQAHYCGTPHRDVPANCTDSGQQFNGAQVWCCN